MDKDKTPLASVARLTAIERDALSSAGITSVEDLLAILKSYKGETEKIAGLLGLSEDRIPLLTREARACVTREFIEILDAPFDSGGFHFGALPPDQDREDPNN
jgi:hypothetical protein